MDLITRTEISLYNQSITLISTVLITHSVDFHDQWK